MRSKSQKKLDSICQVLKIFADRGGTFSLLTWIPTIILGTLTILLTLTLVQSYLKAISFFKIGQTSSRNS